MGPNGPEEPKDAQIWVENGPKGQNVPKFRSKPDRRGKACPDLGQNWPEETNHAQIWGKIAKMGKNITRFVEKLTINGKRYPD